MLDYIELVDWLTRGGQWSAKGHNHKPRNVKQVSLLADWSAHALSGSQFSLD